MTPNPDRRLAWPARLYDAFGHVEEAVAMILLVGIVLVVMLQVVGRYLLPNPFIWPEELTRLMLVWLTFIGGAAVTRRGAHIAVDLLVSRLPEAWRRIVDVAISLATAGVFAWAAWLAFVLAKNVTPLPLAATRWSMGAMVWPAAVGCALIAAHALIRALRPAGAPAP